jgi:hypothetical protein
MPPKKVEKPMELCHLCHETLKHDAIVAHIKHVHGIADCCRKNIDQYNKSDDEEEEGIPADRVIDAIEEHIQAIHEGREDDMDERIQKLKKEFVPAVRLDMKRFIEMTEGLQPADIDPVLMSEIRNKCMIVEHVPAEEKIADDEGMDLFPQPEVLDVPLWDFTKDDGHTLDAYTHDTGINSTMMYHWRWLSACIGVCTNTGCYIVKQRIDGKTTWAECPRNTLIPLLRHKSAQIMHSGKTTDWTYDRFLDVPAINNTFMRYDSIGFHSPDPRVFNLWQGHAFPIMHDAQVINMDLLQPFLDHCRDVICAGNEENYQFEMMKNAWMYQHPNDHLGFATVLIGEQGAGKGHYTDLLCDLWGENWTQRNINSMDEITSDVHKDLIANKKLIVPNEIRAIEGSGKRQQTNWDTLKSRITDSSYNMRNFFERLVKVRNVNNYVFVTNNWDSIQMGVRDRRYFVLDVSDIHLQDIPYFGRLLDSFTEEMKMHLLNYFLRMDTTGFNPFKPPETELKREIQESQLPPAVLWIREFEFPEEGCLSLEEMWSTFVNWADARLIDRNDIGKFGTGFGRLIAPYCSKQKHSSMGGKYTYSKKEEPATPEAGILDGTITPAQRKKMVEQMMKKKRKE